MGRKKKTSNKHFIGTKPIVTAYDTIQQNARFGMFTSALVIPTKRTERSHNEATRISKMTKKIDKWNHILKPFIGSLRESESKF